ncbi:putative reverse transcriptase domain-containing protein, partial [Tanacetum coccineum]
MVNVIPLDHDHDVPVVKPNQHDDAPIVLELVLEDEDEDPEEDEDDMEINIEEDENESELTYPYEEVDPLNPSLPASECEPDNEIKVENPIEHEDETIPVSVFEVGESSTAAIPREDGDRLLPGFMRRDIDSLFGQMVNFLRRLCGRKTAHALVEKKGEAKDKFYGKLILDLGNEVRFSVEQGTDAMEKLVEKLGNVEEKVECKKLKKELKEARLSNIFLHMQNERVERDLYWTRVRAHEFYQEMIRRGFIIMPPKSAPMTQAAMRRLIKESVDAAIAAKPERQAKVKNNASGSGPCNPTVFHRVEGDVELRRWFKKTESVFRINECAEGKKVRFAAATLEGPALTWWNSKIVTLGLETVNRKPWTEIKHLMTAEFCPIEEIQCMEHELWNLRVNEYDIVAYTQRFNELALMCPRMVELERVKVDAYIRGLTNNIKGEVTSSKPADLNKAVRMDHKLMEQKPQAINERIFEGNVGAMVTAPTDGKLPLCERCFTQHVGQCMIKCHKCRKVGHKSRYCKEKSVATGANAQPVWTCYDCGEQGHTRNRCPKKVKSFVNTRFSSLLDIKPIKIEDSYEVELADGRVLGTFDIINGMDWLVKYDFVIVCGEKVVRIPYGNKTLIVE